MSEEQYLFEIELPIWQDPQGDLILEKSREYCYVYFGCWDKKSPPNYAEYIGRIEFINAWSVRSLDVEFYDIHPRGEYLYPSSIYIIKNSEWFKDVFNIRNEYYSDSWTKWKDKNYKHYLVKGHDNYFEIIAEDFEVKKIDKAQAGKYAVLIEE
ncbi:hypothetical protein BC781_1251 [Sediminitomix flava]|uniref:Uncharacterized protein n=2 Tax=Sediminitomix flava TaxID=379075 RepID=A0A315YTV4_SEDFL|nr:hypothetical protein BC781_1251 [Sediminitomix flava]